jgi:2-amino-4-hydroxy-6-hydroxymethyldihydropteridine diphosphokinase
MAEALLGLGGNVGEVRAALDEAVALLADGKDTTLRSASSQYLTPPWGVLEQPRFTNMAIAVDTTLSARALLERAMNIESAFDRDRYRERRWGPRPVDIDLLSYDNLVVNEPGLILPHPRLFGPPDRGPQHQGCAGGARRSRHRTLAAVALVAAPDAFLSSDAAPLRAWHFHCIRCRGIR